MVSLFVIVSVIAIAAHNLALCFYYIKNILDFIFQSDYFPHVNLILHSLLFSLDIIRDMCLKCLRFRLHLRLIETSRMAIQSILEEDKYLQLLCVPLEDL